ncbi:formylglycine-generating enzyme family protein [Desulfosarcina sp. OttesenSCG-928-G10]|nr:formylglycine-generating enzyme family protein [Desulfosarcina sp. OttesenSCG-928-G10]MDL2321950.1 formylglycine-generating enzyme family protein [Desulfosarcina sp. OttesenSCG-928-B08]
MKKTVVLFLAFSLTCFLGAGLFACSQEESRIPIRPQKKTKVNADADSQQQPSRDISYSKTHTNSIGMEFVLILPGNFMMGCNKTVENCNDNETPQHAVMIAKPFYLGKYEVTQAQWQMVMGHSPSKFEGGAKPVEQVSWKDAQAFIHKLNQKEETDQYRLPTEAEWEYAARAGSTAAYCFGYDAMQLGGYAWHGGEYDVGGPHPVGQLKPNAWGLYDMHGNVWEWVQDVYQDRYGVIPDVDANEPSSEPSPGDLRVIRGGSWANSASRSRSAFRTGRKPDYRNRTIGFRLVFSPERQQPDPIPSEETVPEQTPEQTDEPGSDKPPVSDNEANSPENRAAAKESGNT